MSMEILQEKIRKKKNPALLCLDPTGDVIPPHLLEKVPPERREALEGVLALDPRPHYQDDPDRVYGFVFAGLEVRFSVEGDHLTVREIAPAT